MHRNIWLGLLASLASVMVEPVFAQQQKPNVVFILADNVGYGDLGSYGGGELRGAPTPRLDQLAKEGLRLTQFLVEPACTPSRAALMTGQYSIRSGLSLIAIEGSPVYAPHRPSRWVSCLRALATLPRSLENGTWGAHRRAYLLHTASTSFTASHRILAGTQRHTRRQSP